MTANWKGWIKRMFDMFGKNKWGTRAVYQSLQASRLQSDHAKAKAAKEKRIAMTQVLQPAYTKRLRPEPEETVNVDYTPCAKRSVPLSLNWHGMTDTGMVRPQNEDSFGCLALAKKGTLLVVADGMGGHDAGEVASKIAVDTICQEVRRGVEQNKDPLDLIRHAVQQANTAVRQEGRARGSNMGTTLSAAFVAGNTAYIANVGDSRVYWVENGSITQITQDHSLVAKLTAAGKLTKEEARKHPKSNLLYRTVGTDDAINVDTFRLGLKKGGNLLLCTDGLWGEIADEAIHQVFAAEKDVKKTCSRLVQMANDNGGADNITALIARVA